MRARVRLCRSTTPCAWVRWRTTSSGSVRATSAASVSGCVGRWMRSRAWCAARRGGGGARDRSLRGLRGVSARTRAARVAAEFVDMCALSDVDVRRLPVARGEAARRRERDASAARRAVGVLQLQLPCVLAAGAGGAAVPLRGCVTGGGAQLVLAKLLERLWAEAAAYTWARPFLREMLPDGAPPPPPPPIRLCIPPSPPPPPPAAGGAAASGGAAAAAAAAAGGGGGGGRLLPTCLCNVISNVRHLEYVRDAHMHFLHGPPFDIHVCEPVYVT